MGEPLFGPVDVLSDSHCQLNLNLNFIGLGAGPRPPQPNPGSHADADGPAPRDGSGGLANGDWETVKNAASRYKEAQKTGVETGYMGNRYYKGRKWLPNATPPTRYSPSGRGGRDLRKR